MNPRMYEDFQPGQVFAHRDSKTITEEDNRLFCRLTCNPHPLHTDEEYARDTRFGKRVVVGTFVLSLAVGLSVSDVSLGAIVNVGYDEVCHHAPVFIGDTLSVSSTVIDKWPSRSGKAQGMVQVLTTACNQHGKGVLTFSRTVLLPCREKPEKPEKQEKVRESAPTA